MEMQLLGPCGEPVWTARLSRRLGHKRGAPQEDHLAPVASVLRPGTWDSRPS